MKGHFAATALVVLGFIFLMANLGVFTVDIRQLVQTWWPLILIVVGVGLFFTPRDKDDRH
jgi:predicted permease